MGALGATGSFVLNKGAVIEVKLHRRCCHSSEVDRMMMRIVVKLILLGALTGIFLAPSPARAESPNDILVITSKSTKIDKISIEELRTLFLKNRERYKNGDRAVPVNAPDGSSLRKRFVGKVLGMGVEQERAYWQKQKIMKGQSSPPTFSNICKAIFRLRGSIGYVLRSDYKNVNKILLVIPE